MRRESVIAKENSNRAEIWKGEYDDIRLCGHKVINK